MITIVTVNPEMDKEAREWLKENECEVKEINLYLRKHKVAIVLASL